MSSDTKSELAAILNDAAIFPLDDRAFLHISGSDATRWLNGMVTNSIQSLKPGEGNYNFLLNAQGRIQGDCTIYRYPKDKEAAFVLATDKSQIETITQLLDKFIIMDDVELKTMDYYDQGLLLLGPKATKVLREIDDPFLGETLSALEPLRLGYYQLTSEQVTTPSPGLVPRFEVTADTMRDILIKDALAAGATLVSAESIEQFRILEGRPRFGVDIRDKDLPQETNQTHALHFSKGCYLGQEIVERIRSRGQVHRTFSGFRLTALPATFPTPLTSEGKPAGELTSAATIGEQTLALGYVRREALDRNQPLEYEGGSATPSALPFPMTTFSAT